ncbi:hypothetical protein Fluta_1732 [Fluviicola taffensis DSM 16823]|uniref:Uncharacterized protein n=1 Tax=Fluviicola taffensis (strain DSM 16823 / NCIMB 13979 / RW262) TaxID=755732 RepID=F2IHF9_FLUTR|nr:hypothetical protein Fluta_1732 [Fluviicola taffensis DSM 16823]
MIDYIFYRISNYYISKKEASFGYSVAFVCFVYISFLFFVINLINLYFEGIFSKESLVFNAYQLKWMYGITCILIVGFNLVRYGSKKRRTQIFDQYKDSRKNRFIKTWQIFVFPIIVFAFSIALMKMLK